MAAGTAFLRLPVRPSVYIHMLRKCSGNLNLNTILCCICIMFMKKERTYVEVERVIMMILYLCRPEEAWKEL